MKLIVCSIKDSALEAYMRPFFVPTSGMAVRAFTDEVNKAGSEMGAHRGDYVLFEIATFDEDSGLFENRETPRQLIRGSDLGD